ncbi:glycosyltransferase family 2 protein [Kallotenue papyrolyticum]|uniref:glycosyltransferase family 2 protein n=1 Tax=Kallotenue papyrolyticum TaxID=1325125 RepID=UPI0013775AB0|nr:glycosyltransferase family 2 protein [Kallotenue papyrolyticum]
MSRCDTSRKGSKIVFWGSIGLLTYTYIGFPLITIVRGLLHPRRVRRDPTWTPKVSLIIAAYNEAAVIQRKLDNTFALDYPSDRLEVIVASDGSDDGTPDLARRYPARVTVLDLPRQGKNLTLNAAVAVATGDILVFSDADSMLQADALRWLVAPFADPSVGGVGGDYRYDGVRAVNQGERTYWDFDRLLKRLQSRSGSMTSAGGQLYAIRRQLYRPIPPGVTDDFFVSVQVPVARQRLIFEPRAIARGPIAASPRAEFRRKVRVMTAGLRGVWAVRQALHPGRYGFFAIQLASHKVLRRLMVVPLLGTWWTAHRLRHCGLLYRGIAAGHAIVHLLALLGLMLRSTPMGRSKIVSLPLFFDMVNLAAIAALWGIVRSVRHDIWTPQRESRVEGDVSCVSSKYSKLLTEVVSWCEDSGAKRVVNV